MKKQKLFELYATLEKLKNIDANIKFSYAIAANLSILKPEIEILQNLINKRPKQFSEFEKKRIALCEQYADKDKDGKPIITHNQNGTSDYLIIKQLPDFEKATLALKNEYAEMHKEIEKYTAELQDILNEEFETKLYNISFNILPTSGITPATIEILMPLIVDIPDFTSKETSAEKKPDKE